MSPGSIMPPFNWLIEKQLDISTIEKKIRVMLQLGVPYPPDYDKKAKQDLILQAEQIAARLKESNIEAGAEREIIALIGYLQRLGVDIKGSE
jgi:cytochrome c oxidase cbb3-type subunit I/II